MLRFLFITSIILSVAACSVKHPRKRSGYTACEINSSSKSSSGTNIFKQANCAFTLERGGESMTARFWLWEKAKTSIDIQHYIFKTDHSGQIAKWYLLRAADRGVKIRILIDEIAVKLGTKEMLRFDKHENIEVRVFNPGLIHSTNIFQRIGHWVHKPDRMLRRLHIKTITIDHRICIMGGRNIADEYFDRDHNYNFRDRDIFFTGDAMHAVNESFEQYWNSELSIPLSVLKKRKAKRISADSYRIFYGYECDTINFSVLQRKKIQEYSSELEKKEQNELHCVDKITYIADHPAKVENGGKKHSISNDSIIQILLNAKKTIEIQTPYLILDEQLKSLFSSMQEKKIKVKVLTNSMASTDNNEAFAAYQKDRKEILGYGIELYELKPHPSEKYSMMDPEIQEKLNYKPVLGLHSKTVVVDSLICIIGTYNLDPRSADLNSECTVVIRSEGLSNYLLRILDLEFQKENSWRISTEFNPDKEAGLKKRVKIFTRKIFPRKIL